MKKWEISLLLGLILALLLGQFNAFAATCAQVRTDTLRLHILANSDTPADQACKLAVRDAILQEYGHLLAGADAQPEAATLAEETLSSIRATAQQVVADMGYRYTVAAEVTRMYFDTKEYEGFILPAGEYDALRITLGEAAGKNWFCVMYPPLCLPAATGAEGMKLYSAEERAAITSPYTVKFALLEWLQKQ